ncbi:reverse transcriptase, partial [Candidatus Kaiserbacteria bacterium]|nr:reverse transcriptase [Candidatus Kaiserbacteria bacterium]
VKHALKVKYYIRYADDFVVLSPARDQLVKMLPLIERFLRIRLNLILHPDKVLIKTLASGVDFLGWVHFPDHRVLRSATKRRMLRKIAENPNGPTIGSYYGMLSHGNAHTLSTLLQERLAKLEQRRG